MGKKQMKNPRSYGNVVNLITAQYYTEYYNNEGGNGVQGLIHSLEFQLVPKGGGMSNTPLRISPMLHCHAFAQHLHGSVATGHRGCSHLLSYMSCHCKPDLNP
jgi:hypothetical protein